MTAAGWVRRPHHPALLVAHHHLSLLRRSCPAAPSPTSAVRTQAEPSPTRRRSRNNHNAHHIRFWYCPPGWVLPGGGRVDWLAAATCRPCRRPERRPHPPGHPTRSTRTLDIGPVQARLRRRRRPLFLMPPNSKSGPELPHLYRQRTGGDRVVTGGSPRPRRGGARVRLRALPAPGPPRPSRPGGSSLSTHHRPGPHRDHDRHWLSACPRIDVTDRWTPLRSLA